VKSYAFAGVLLVAFCVCSVAKAGDMAAYKASPPLPGAAMPGMFYAGISIGARRSDTDWTTTQFGSAPAAFPSALTNPASFDSSTVRIGGYVGHMWRFAPQWTIGIEGDLAWGDSRRTVIGIPGICCGGTARVREGWDGSIRARFGYLLTPSWLLYGTGGVAWQSLQIDASCGPKTSFCTTGHDESLSDTRTGWTLGAGLEVMLKHNWLLRLEYRFSDYGHLDHTFFLDAPADRVVMNQSLKTETILVGAAYKLGPPAAPVIAKH
jgi:outer membrane immunogenic protein